MRALLVAPAVAALVAACGPLTAHADPATLAADPATPSAPSPPFVDHTRWTKWQGRDSLRVFPSESGRLAARQPGSGALAEEAWREVLASAPDADTPGMRAQFDCHWQFAELAQPGKASWNLEPWRPVVDDNEMVASGCNPGGPEENLQ